MDMREVFTIDGRRFSNMAGFYDEVEQVFTCGLDWKIGRNLDAFNDILRGGFGRHEYGQPIRIQWLAYEKASAISERDYGHHYRNHFGYGSFRARLYPGTALTKQKKEAMLWDLTFTPGH